MVFNYSISKIINYSRLYSRGTFTRIFRKKYFCICSHWESEFMLEKYRNSKILNSIWRKIKLYFRGKPKAWSLNSINNG